MDNILTLIIEFFKTGLFAVGGGLATIPFLGEMGLKYGWFTTDMLSTMIAVSESTPGPIGVNMATYVGYNVAGVLGALLATLSLVAPSLIVICIVAKYYQSFKESKLVKMIFAGIKPAVVAFIGSACLSLFISVLFNKGNTGVDFFDIKSIILLAALLLASRKFKDAHPIVFIIASAIIGIIFKF